MLCAVLGDGTMRYGTVSNVSAFNQTNPCRWSLAIGCCRRDGATGRTAVLYLRSDSLCMYSMLLPLRRTGCLYLYGSFFNLNFRS